MFLFGSASQLHDNAIQADLAFDALIILRGYLSRFPSQGLPACG
jgi:hypothetical protein